MNTGRARYDAVLVLSSRIQRAPDGRYAPATYDGGGTFGISGGHLRVVAAGCQVERQESQCFVFCGGRSAKHIGTFGPAVPASGLVHMEALRSWLKSNFGGPLPTMLLEQRSVNTAGNLYHGLQMAQKFGHRRIGILSSAFHLERAELLCSLLEHGFTGELTFLSAEDIVRHSMPGVFDSEIDAAYASAAGLLRLKNEQQGCNDIRAGVYDLAEQCAPRMRRRNSGVWGRRLLSGRLSLRLVLVPRDTDSPIDIDKVVGELHSFLSTCSWDIAQVVIQPDAALRSRSQGTTGREARRLYEQEQLTVRQVAEAIGWSRSWTHTLLVAAGTRMRVRGAVKPDGR